MRSRGKTFDDTLGVPFMFYPWDETRGPEAWPIGSCQRSCETSHLRASATPWYWAITFGSGAPAAPHSAAILPAVLPKLVGYDYRLGKLARRLKCGGERRVRVRAVEAGER